MICIVLGVAASATRNSSRPSNSAFRTIEDAFAVHRSQGWSLVSAPTDGRRYRICGATQSDPNSGASSFRGSFKTGGRYIDFDIELPDGAIVAVEGLDPIDGGPLSYAVLVRNLPE